MIKGKFIQLRVTEEEKKIVKQKADQNGMNISDYIISLIKEDNKKQNRNNELINELNELKNIYVKENLRFAIYTHTLLTKLAKKELTQEEYNEYLALAKENSQAKGL